MTLEKYISLIDSEVNSLETGIVMWKRIIEGYKKDKININTAYQLGLHLEKSYGPECIAKIE